VNSTFALAESEFFFITTAIQQFPFFLENRFHSECVCFRTWTSDGVYSPRTSITNGRHDNIPRGFVCSFRDVLRPAIYVLAARLRVLCCDFCYTARMVLFLPRCSKADRPHLKIKSAFNWSIFVVTWDGLLLSGNKVNYYARTTITSPRNGLALGHRVRLETNAVPVARDDERSYNNRFRRCVSISQRVTAVNNTDDHYCFDRDSLLPVYFRPRVRLDHLNASP